MSYKRINNILSAVINESRNAPSANGTIVVSGDTYVQKGDTILIAQKDGKDLRYFSFLVSDKEVSQGNTTLTVESLIKQLFKCIIPDMDPQQGNAADIIKSILNEANNRHFTDIYVDDANIDSASMAYTNVNVKNRYIGEIFQDICKDAGFVMWVGYDELHDKPNAFFFRNSVDIEQESAPLKEGDNIISETLKESPLDDIVNYVILYFYPKQFPQDESWSEGGQQNKVYYAQSATVAKPWWAAREVHIRQTGPHTKLAQAAQSGDTSLVVASTAGFDDSGMIYLNGDEFSYGSKDSTHFFLNYGLYSDISVEGSFIYQKSQAQPYDPDNPVFTDCEFVVQSFILYKDYPITRIKINGLQKYGSPGNLWIRIFDSAQSIIFEQEVTSFNGIIDLTGLNIFTSYGWVICDLYLSVDESATNDDYYTIPMGPAMSATGQDLDCEYWYWRAKGAPSKWDNGENDELAISMPNQQLAIEMISKYNDNDELWTSSNCLVTDQVWYLPWSAMFPKPTYMAKEGADCLRIIGNGSIVHTEDVGISDFDRFHFWYIGRLSKVKLVDDSNNYYYQDLESSDYWSEATLSLSKMRIVGSPGAIIHSIEFYTDGPDTLLDGIYFLYPDSGIVTIAKDDDSVVKYRQHAQVVSARGVTDSSFALSLAQKIVDDRKDPKWTGKIKVKDFPNRYTARKKIKVIIPSKNINDVLEIYSVTHTFDGYAELEVGSFYWDYQKYLATLQSRINNLELTVAALPRSTYAEDIKGTPYINHALKHQSGGSDEVNVEGLTGELAAEQKSNWAKITDKPTSTVAEIDDAVAKRHGHTNKVLLDSYDQSNANLADAVSKKHSHTNKTLLDSYDQTNADLADAVSKKHSQNTDTGTSSPAFLVGGNPVLLATAENKTIYVDNTNGDDTAGDGSSAHPYKTVHKASSVIPDSLTCAITIHLVASPTMYDSFVLFNKIFTATGGSLTVEGEMTQIENGTISGYIYNADDPNYARAKVLEVEDNSKSWATDQFKYKILHIYDTSGFSFYSVIDSNDATHLYCAHMYYGDITGKSYEVLDWGTQIDYIYITSMSGAVTVRHLWVNPTSASYAVKLGNLDNFNLTRCRVDKNHDGGMAVYFVASSIGIQECYLEGHKTNYDGIFAGYGLPARMFVSGTKVVNFRDGVGMSGVIGQGFFRDGSRLLADSDDSVALRGMLLNGPENMSFYSPRGKVVIDGYPTGISAWSAATLQYDEYIVAESSVTTPFDMFFALNYSGDFEIKGNFNIRPTATTPTTTPANGGVLYTASGNLYYRGSNGTVTKLGDA